MEAALIAACRRCGKWMIKEGDSPTDRRIKSGLGGFVQVYLPLGVIFAMMTLTDTMAGFFLTGCLLTVCAHIYFVMRAKFGCEMGATLDIWIPVLSVALVCGDIFFASELDVRSWSTAVILLDVALVFDRPKPIPIVLFVVIMWLCIDAFESVARLGIYEAGGYYPASIPPRVCACAEPPCDTAVMRALGALSQSLAVLLVDFSLTRSFATDLRTQLRRVNASIEMAAKVTAALARYDIDRAEQAIAHGEELPKELAKSFLQLLSNLETYRRYLPDALLQYDDDVRAVSGLTGVTGPMFGAEIAMVFTDIQSSTALWEGYPSEMYEALKIHNKVLRDVATECLGYEVKVIGDAFMLAFCTAANAVEFGAAAQLKLVQSEWPPGLCEHPLCKRVEGLDGVPLWHGPRVRIGINWGPAEMEKNPVTGRH
eukprot:Hpha_TRINITY_DN15800_c6_g8::TRINITY_DN15800_c6_g8_i2::g.187040::m.187040